MKLALALAVLLRDDKTLLTNLDDLMFLLEVLVAEVSLVPDSEVCGSAGLDDLHALPPLPAQPGHAGPGGNIQDLELSLSGGRQLGWRTDGGGVDRDQSWGWSGGSARQQHRLVRFPAWRTGPQLGERPGNLNVNRRLIWRGGNFNDLLLCGHI